MYKLKPKDIVYLLLYAIPHTALSFGIIHIINNALSGNQRFLNSGMAIVFVALVGYAYLLNIVFQKRLNKYAFNILYKNEKKLFGQILSAPLATLEKFGSQRFYTAMEDLRLFATLPHTITHTTSSLLMLILGVAYMFSLSAQAAAIVLAIIVLVAGCYFIVMHTMAKPVAQLRQYNEKYYGYVKDLIDGFKELKMSSTRRTNIMGKYLGPNRDASEKLDFRVHYVFLSINMISQYGLYVVIAAILFGLPALGLLEQEGVIAYVVVILFISGPINNLINLQQAYTRFMVADKRIKSFMKDFQIAQTPLEVTENTIQPFESLRFEDISYRYASQDKDQSFALGPINLEVNQGEVLFVVGGNGSGKSTFINIMTGLYTPSAGSITLNGQPIADIKENLREQITSIFTNNYIFSNNYDDYQLQDNPQYKLWLDTMQLGQVVTDDNEASARRQFSKGQSKRMSMIFAMLEQKPILILDEWAADQDPHFRKYFYEELVPKFKAQGKTIIAVTHDDAYFHHADRIVKFDYGKIVKDIKVQDKATIEEVIWAE